MANLNRLEKLGALLESKNRLLRQEAVNLLAKMPIIDSNLFDTLWKFLNSPVWEARNSAAEAIGKALANSFDKTIVSDFSEDWECSTSYEQEDKDVKICLNSLEDLDLNNIIEMYRPLLRLVK